MFHQGFKQQTRDEISVSWLDDHVMNNLWVRETQLIYVYSFCRSSCDLDFPDKILQGALGAKLFCDNSRPLRDDDFTINLTLGEKFIIGIFYTICRANSNKLSSSLVSTSSLSIYDKTRGEKALTSRQNRFFRASKQSFAIYSPLATYNICPVAIPWIFAQTQGSIFVRQLFHTTRYSAL